MSIKIKKGVTRREFLITTAFAGVSCALVSPLKFSGANNRLRVGVIGAGRAGLKHAVHFASQKNVEVAALCDISQSTLGRIATELIRAGFRKPDLFLDFRRLLDRPDVDAVSIAVPRALRAQLAVKACEAGKDVLIEKPCCDGLREGRTLEMAANGTQRVVQQIDDSPVFSAPELSTMLLTQGATKVQHIYCRQSLFSMAVEPGGGFQSGQSAVMEKSLGILDLARNVLGVRFPVSVQAGGLTAKNFHDAASVQFGFADSGFNRTIRLESFVTWSPNDGEQLAPKSRYPDFRLTFVLPQQEFTVASTPAFTADEVAANSWANFVSCVRERNFGAAQNPIHQARFSAGLVKLAEASMVLGRGFTFDPNKEQAGDDEVNALIQ